MPTQSHVERAARLTALIEARDRGWLNDIKRIEIARLFGVNRSTLTRDYQDMPKFDRLKQKYLDILETAK